MTIAVQALIRYPVKGLSGQQLSSVKLEPNQGFPSDRRFGFARPDSGFNPDNPKPLKKTKFYMLARDASLALINAQYEDETGILSMSAPSIANRQFDITTNTGKHDASLFLKSYLSLPDDETPQLYEASPHRFTDVSVDSVEMMNAVSIINIDSVQAFSDTIGKEVDPGRFRGNIQLTGLPAFSELEMLGKHITIGAAQFKVVARTKRCPATQVNLNTAERDIKTPKLLLEHYGHMDMGIYAEVIAGGEIAPGDTITIS